jgi:hypothetical protein
MNSLGLSVTNNQNVSVFDKISDGTCSLIMDSEASTFTFKTTKVDKQIVIDIPNESITGAKLEDEDFQELIGHASTTLHYHDTDRERTNHTGTQLSSTISDLTTTIQTDSHVSEAYAHSSNSDIHLTSTQKTDLTSYGTIDWHTHEISSMANAESYITGLITSTVGQSDQVDELDSGDVPNFSGIKSDGALTLTIADDSTSYLDALQVQSNIEDLKVLSANSQGLFKLYNAGPEGPYCESRILLSAYSGANQDEGQWRLGNPGEDVSYSQTDDDLLIENSKTSGKIFVRTKNSTDEVPETRATIDDQAITLSSDLAIGGEFFLNSSTSFYATGTWTPTIGCPSGYLSDSYTNMEMGEYVRIASLVYLNFYIDYLNDGSHSGNLYIGGIPFLKYNGTGMCYSSTGTVTLSCQNLTPSSDQVPFCLYLHYNWSHMAIIESYDNDNYSWVPIDGTTSGAHPFLRGSIVYRCREYT